MGRGFESDGLHSDDDEVSRRPSKFASRMLEAQVIPGRSRLVFLIDRATVIQMETVTISPKFQVVIPQKIREAMGLRSGEKAKMICFKNRIEIIPMRDARQLRGYLRGLDTTLERDGDRL